MRTVKVRTTNGQQFLRAGIAFGPDPIEVKIGEKRNAAQYTVTEDDLENILRAAKPYEIDNPDERQREQMPKVRSGSVLAVEEDGRQIFPREPVPRDAPQGPYLADQTLGETRRQEMARNQSVALQPSVPPAGEDNALLQRQALEAHEQERAGRATSSTERPQSRDQVRDRRGDEDKPSRK